MRHHVVELFQVVGSAASSIGDGGHAAPDACGVGVVGVAPRLEHMGVNVDEARSHHLALYVNNLGGLLGRYVGSDAADHAAGYGHVQLLVPALGRINDRPTFK